MFEAGFLPALNNCIYCSIRLLEIDSPACRLLTFMENNSALYVPTSYCRTMSLVLSNKTKSGEVYAQFTVFTVHLDKINNAKMFCFMSYIVKLSSLWSYMNALTKKTLS